MARRDAAMLSRGNSEVPISLFRAVATPGWIAPKMLYNVSRRLEIVDTSADTRSERRTLPLHL